MTARVSATSAVTVQPPLRLTPPPPTPHPEVRYAGLVPGERQLLLVLEAQGGSADLGILANALNLSEWELQARLTALTAAGMVERRPGRCALPDELRERVRRDLNAAVGARVVLRSENTVRCPAPHAGERVLRSICREVFAPHVVRPRVPLRQVLDVQAMNSLLDGDDRAFLANGNVHLDVVVEDAETEQALLALELDGPQHQESPQLERDRRKDRILRVAGLPLLRLWTCQAEPPGEGLMRALLGWRLQGALANPDFLRACPPALRDALRDGTKKLEDQGGLGAVLGGELLTALLGGKDGQDLASPGGMARLETLQQIVAALRATHSEAGVRQWFDRARYTLRGHSPRDILHGDWSPQDARVGLVCRLAAAGGSFFAT